MASQHIRSIVLISYHFHPSFEIGAKRVTALARYLAERNIRVIVVSEFGGKPPKAHSEMWPGVIAIPVPNPKRLVIDTLLRLKGKEVPSGSVESRNTPAVEGNAGSERPSRRVISWFRDMFFRVAYFIDAYKKWAWNASKAAVIAGRQYDASLVISSSPPRAMSIAGMRAARKLRVPHILDLRDPWTDIPTRESADKYRFERAVLRRIEHMLVNSAAATTSAGSSVVNILGKNYPVVRSRLHVVRNGFDGLPQKSSRATGNRLVILFAGELYINRNPFPLLNALETLLAKPGIDASRIKVTFMGRCSVYANQPLADWLAGKRCESVVKILPQMPPQTVAEATAEATVLLNLAQKQPLSVPAKTFEHIASGREILLLCEADSETAKVVEGLAGVLRVDHGDELERALADLYQRHVVEGQLTAPSEADAMRFSRTAANEQFLNLMNTLTSARG